MSSKIINKIIFLTLIYTCSLYGYTFSNIQLENVSSLPKEIEILIDSKKDIEMTQEDIFKLLKDINNYYISKGNITSQVLIKEANADTKTLVFELKEGKIDNISLSNVDSVLNLEKEDVAKKIENDYKQVLSLAGNIESEDELKIQDIDQLTENLKTPLTDVKINISPSKEKSNYSEINIEFNRKKNIFGNVYINNEDDNENVLFNYGFRVGRDYLFSAGDLLVLDFSQKLFDDKYSDNVSRNISLMYSLPINKTKLTYTLSNSKNSSYTISEKTNKKICTTNNELTNKINIETMLYRDNKTKFSVYGYLKHSAKETYALGEKIDVSSQIYTRAGIGLKYFKHIDNGYLNADLGIEKGLAILGAKAKENEKDFDKEFTKFKFNLELEKNYYLSQERYLKYNMNLGAMYTNANLLDRDKSNLGGLDTIRGFKDSTATGTDSIYINNTLTLAQKHISPFIGLDFGCSRDKTRGYDDILSGIAAGVKVNYENLEAKLTIARALTRGKNMKDEATVAIFNILYKF